MGQCLAGACPAAAATLRQQERDLGFVAEGLRDFNERQSQLFFILATFLLRYDPPELQPLIDDDVAAAAAALAATFETAARGVIFEHRPASLPADRLATSLKTLLVEAGQNAPHSSFERDAAVVLRRIEESARNVRAFDASNRRGLLDLLGRVMRRSDGDGDTGQQTASEPSRLIVP